MNYEEMKKEIEEVKIFFNEDYNIINADDEINIYANPFVNMLLPNKIDKILNILEQIINELESMNKKDTR